MSWLLSGCVLFCVFTLKCSVDPVKSVILPERALQSVQHTTPLPNKTLNLTQTGFWGKPSNRFLMLMYDVQKNPLKAVTDQPEDVFKSQVFLVTLTLRRGMLCQLWGLRNQKVSQVSCSRLFLFLSTCMSLRAWSAHQWDHASWQVFFACLVLINPPQAVLWVIADISD